MRVVYVSKALAVAAYRDKVRELADRMPVTAVMPDRWDGPAPEPSPDGVPEPERVRVRLPGSNHLHHYPGAGRWLDRLAPDLVHVDEEPYSLVTWQLGRLCRKRGIPFLFFAWQNVDRRLPPPFGHIRATVFRCARGAIAGTAAAARCLRGAGYDGPLEIIPQFGVDPGRFAPDPDARPRARRRFRLPGEAFVIGFGGRLVPGKGVGTLVEALAGLRTGSRADAGQADRAPRLVLIGDGPERASLERTARRAGIADRVHFLGRVPSLSMPDAIRACDVMALPSVGTPTWTEQFGRILVEAMACGVPVVGTRCGEIPRVIGDAGEVVPPGDADALAGALDRLRRSPELRTHRAAAGRARVLDRFTQGRIAEETVAFYRKLRPALEPVP